MISITAQSHANHTAAGQLRRTGQRKHHVPKANSNTFSRTKARSRSDDTKPVRKRAGGNDSHRCPKYSSVEWAAWTRISAPNVIWKRDMAKTSPDETKSTGHTARAKPR